MNIQNLALMLGLKQGTEISNASSIFLEQVKDYMNSAQDNPSEAHAKAEEGALTMLYQNFFQYAVEWVKEERQKTVEIPSHENAKELKKRANEALTDLQENILKYALCYMRLNRAMGTVQGEMESQLQNGPTDKDIKWTSDTGTLLKRYRQERRKLRSDNKRFANGMKALETAEKNYDTCRNGAVSLFGEKAAEDILRPYRSALRSGDFPKAKKALSSMETAKKKFSIGKKGEGADVNTIQKAGKDYVEVLESVQDDLRTGENKLFLAGKEISVTIGAQEREIEQKTQYINKYHMPYMDHKLKSLRHLREKLLVIGSLESLTTLYIRLIRGIAEPMEDIKKVREYEEEVVERVYYLLKGQFQEVEKIENWNLEAMEEFSESMADFTGTA